MRVLPDRWRSGIGTRLHQACLESWRSRGVRAATLEVWEHNDRARAFYAHHDWRADGHRRPGPDDSEFLRLRRPL